MQQPSSHGARRQASEASEGGGSSTGDDPVAAHSAINTLDPESRVRAGVERVRLVRSAASLNWPVAGRNALEIRVAVIPQLGGPMKALAVVGRDTLHQRKLMLHQAAACMLDASNSSGPAGP